MSLHSIFTFHVLPKSDAAPAAKEARLDSQPQVISATWKATAETLRASLSDKSGRDVELEFT